MADGIKDFSKRDRQPPKFRVGDHVFFGVYALAAQRAMEITTHFGGLTQESPPADQIKAMDYALEAMLQPESLGRFRILMNDTESIDAVDLPQVDEIVTWLLEQYGLRPTQPSETSAPGSQEPDAGTPSTDAAQPVESIPLTSPSIAS